MIDTDKYEEQLEDDNTDTWVVWQIAKESLAEVKRLREALKEANELEWQRREWVDNYLSSKGMSYADVAQGLENYENYRSE